MESNVEDQNTPQASEAAPVRRRASRRATAAAGAVSETPAEAVAPAAEAATAGAAAADPAAAESVAEAPKKRATRTRKKAEAPAAEAAAATVSVSAEAAAADAPAAPVEAAASEAPKKRATRSRKKAEAPAAEAAAETTAAQEAPGADAPAAEAQAEEAPKKRSRSRRAQTTDAAAGAEAGEQSAPAASSQADAENASSAEAAGADTKPAEAAAETERGDGENEGEKSGRGRRGRGRGQKAENAEADSGDSSSDEGKSENARGQKGQNSQNGQNGQNGKQDGKQQSENSARSSRTRQRDRKRRGQNDDLEPEISEEDVLLPIAGILDVLDNYAFVRTSGYLPGTSDVYVSLGQVKKYGLRRGDAVVGAIRQPREGDGGGRQKYNAIVKVDSINGRPVDEEEKRTEFAEQTPVFPQERLVLESGQDALAARAVDLFAPIGLGHRALLAVPAGVEGVDVIVELAQGVSANRPEAHLMLVLAEAQPEEITHLERTIQGEVIAASFDRPAEDQATIAELAFDRAKRLVELGHDVVLFVDSLNRLARAYAQAQHGQARPGADEIDEFALGQIKRLLASGRNLENGGSLTVLATIDAKPELDGDALLLREVRRVVNSEVRFARTRMGSAPAVKVKHSGTRHTGALFGAEEAAALAQLRTAFADLDAEESLEKLRASASNAALLADARRAGARA